MEERVRKDVWRPWRHEIRAVLLNVVNVNLLLAVGTSIRLLVRVSIAELEVSLAVLALAERVGLVDLCVLGELAVGLESTGLVGGVLEDDIALVVLEISEGEKDDIALVDPDLLAHLAANLCKVRHMPRRIYRPGAREPAGGS